MYCIIALGEYSRKAQKADTKFTAFKAELFPTLMMMFPSNPYVPENMPQWAWSNWAELRAFSDCSTDSLGDPHLGEVNVTIPNWKTKDLRYEILASSKLLWISRRAYYASVSHVDEEIGRCS